MNKYYYVPDVHIKLDGVFQTMAAIEFESIIISLHELNVQRLAEQAVSHFDKCCNGGEWYPVGNLEASFITFDLFDSDRKFIGRFSSTVSFSPSFSVSRVKLYAEGAG